MTNNEYMTIQEVIQKTGKSESTIRRWVSDIKERGKDEIKVGKEGKKKYILILKTLVYDTFSIKKDQEERQNSTSIQDHNSASEVYKAMIKILEEQLKEKDKQLSELLKTNTFQSSYIANMKKELLLTGGEGEGEFKTAGNKQNTPINGEEVKETENNTNQTKKPLKDKKTGYKKQLAKSKNKAKNNLKTNGWRRLFGF